MCKVLTTTAVVVAIGCFGQVAEVDGPILRIDAAQPFQVEFGRGSGWEGLDTIKLDEKGVVVLHRMKPETEGDPGGLRWETATLQLRPAALGEVLKAVESNGLMEMRKAYHEDIADGTQWVLWIKQGEWEKAVYFNNKFPRKIVRFAERLDAILSEANLDEAAWRPVPAGESHRHERDLWDSIKR